LLRTGEVKYSTWIFLAGLWGGSLICACLSGGVRSVYMVLHAMVPVVAGPLLGARAAQISLAGSIFAAVCMALGGALGYPLPIYLPMPPVASWLVVVLALTLGTLPVIHVLRALHAALYDAQQQAMRFSHDAMHDPLTGLPNRALFLDRLSHCMTLHKRGSAGCYAVLFIDLDRFKIFNDTMGREYGDRMLKMVAERFAPITRAGDTLARHSGDEFTVLLEGLDDPLVAEAIAGRIVRSLDAAFLLDEHKAFLTASVGIVIGSANYERAEDMLHDADSAMYRAKALGGSRHVVFNEHIRLALIASGELERDLRLACERNEFFLGFEPMVCLKTGHVFRYEALLRWQHPTRGLLYPKDFLRCAEESDLILKVDRWVMKEACKQLAKWRRFDVPLDVNVSGRSLRESGFIESVTRQLKESGVQARMLKLEITEQVLVDAAQGFPVLERLRELGIELVLDDFGTGYSSLSYLTRFPISHLKIDRTFIGGLETNDRSRIVVSAIVSLAAGLGMEVTAEGVETPSLLKIVGDLGCQYGQGYHLGQGLKPEEVEKCLSAAAGASGQRRAR
jgi:diguanylate cyclase (GGDEF)-like protein